VNTTETPIKRTTRLLAALAQILLVHGYGDHDVGKDSSPTRWAA
jgi:hypothetical protein